MQGEREQQGGQSMFPRQEGALQGHALTLKVCAWAAWDAWGALNLWAARDVGRAWSAWGAWDFSKARAAS